MNRSSRPGDVEELCQRSKKTLPQKSVKVHFVGVWHLRVIHSRLRVLTHYAARDTVSLIGVTRRPSFPEAVNGMKHVCVFRHALALDERRVKFLPEYVNGGDGPQQPGKREEEGDVK